jgi:multimeric flavodoxin WrbA
MSTLAHHGMIFVSLGYKTTLEIQSGLEEARGGSPWGAGTYTVSPGCLIWRDFYSLVANIGS